jgi:hypothetical protein
MQKYVKRTVSHTTTLLAGVCITLYSEWLPQSLRQIKAVLLANLTVQQLQSAVWSLGLTLLILTALLVTLFIAIVKSYIETLKSPEKRKAIATAFAIKHGCEWNAYGTLQNTDGTTYCPHCAENKKLYQLKISAIRNQTSYCPHCGSEYRRRSTNEELFGIQQK